MSALRTLTGEVQASFAIFVEDRFAEEMALAALRRHHRAAGADLLGVAIHAVGGHGNAAKFARTHNENPAISFRAMAILDGDMQDKVDWENSIVAFPGTGDPELHVALSVASILDRVSAKVAVSLGLPVSYQKRVSDVVRDRMRTNHDPHVLFEQIGEDLDFTAGLTVERTFLNLWAEEFPEEVEAMFAPVREVLPGVKKMEAAASPP